MTELFELTLPDNESSHTQGSGGDDRIVSSMFLDEANPSGPSSLGLLPSTSDDEEDRMNNDHHNNSGATAFNSTTISSNYNKSWSGPVAELIACSVFTIGGILLEAGIVQPNQRPIPYQQLESTGEYVISQVFNETFDGETISTSELMMYGVLIPMIVQLILSGRNSNWSMVHRSTCVHLAAFGITLLLTNSVKLYVGYLRPIFYDVCEPDENYEACTIDDDRPIRVSFPSGHSSISFCGLSLLSFFLERQFGISSIRVLMHVPSTSINNNNGNIILGYHNNIDDLHVRIRRIISIFCYLPMVFAGYIATSRIVDNKHFPADVVGGSVLGTAIAALVHSIW